MGFFRILIVMFDILLLIGAMISFGFVSLMSAIMGNPNIGLSDGVFGGSLSGVIFMIVWFVISIGMIYFGFFKKK